MKLFFYFSSLLLAVTAIYPTKEIIRQLRPDIFRGLKLFNAQELMNQIRHNRLEHKGYIALCIHTYCHGDSACQLGCDKFAMRLDKRAAGIALMSITRSKQPAPDQNACTKECITMCGQQDFDACEIQCGTLCYSHFVYKNRREYEAEFLLFMSRVNEFAATLA